MEGTHSPLEMIELYRRMVSEFPKVMIADTHRKRILGRFKSSVFCAGSISHLKKQGRDISFRPQTGTPASIHLAFHKLHSFRSSSCPMRSKAVSASDTEQSDGRDSRIARHFLRALECRLYRCRCSSSNLVTSTHSSRS